MQPTWGVKMDHRMKNGGGSNSWPGRPTWGGAARPPTRPLGLPPSHPATDLTTLPTYLEYKYPSLSFGYK